MENEKATAQSAQEKPKKSMQTEIFEWVRSIALAVAAALLLRTCLFTFVFVDGESMLNTLHDRDILFVTRYDRFVSEGYERGTVVICNYPNAKGFRVKRIVGLPGETLEIVGGQLRINGIEYAEDYLGSVKVQDYGPITLADDAYFCMGDNRFWSRDSRSPDVGPIPAREIQGVARAVLFPFDRISTDMQKAAVPVSGGNLEG